MENIYVKLLDFEVNDDGIENLMDDERLILIEGNGDVGRLRVEFLF